MALGISLGGNRFACLLGELGETNLIDAACCVSPPFKLWIATGPERWETHAVYDNAMGESFAKLYLDHEIKLKDRFRELTGKDLRHTIESMKTNTLS